MNECVVNECGCKEKLGDRATRRMRGRKNLNQGLMNRRVTRATHKIAGFVLCGRERHCVLAPTLRRGRKSRRDRELVHQASEKAQPRLNGSAATEETRSIMLVWVYDVQQ